MKVKVNGREYEVMAMENMVMVPNVAKTIKSISYLKGKRGAWLAMHERINGSRWIFGFGNGSEEVKYYEEVAA